MLTPLSMSAVFNKLCDKKLEIENTFPQHRPKRVADVVYLNQAEVETLTTNFSVFKG